MRGRQQETERERERERGGGRERERERERGREGKRGDLAQYYVNSHFLISYSGCLPCYLPQSEMIQKIHHQQQGSLTI